MDIFFSELEFHFLYHTIIIVTVLGQKAIYFITA